MKKKKPKKRKDGKVLVWSRYRRDPRTGRILDARKYGYKAWPMWVDDNGQDGSQPSPANVA